VFAVLLLAGGLSWITTGLSLAAPPQGCTCRVSGGVGTRAEGVSTVFTAQVSAQQVDALGTGQQARQVRRYTATVERVYQGTVAQREIVVVSPASLKDCGLGRIPAGKTWLFFVNGTGAKFYGNACQGSERATSALLRRVERVLGSGQVVVEPEPARPPLAWTDVDTATPPPLGRLVAPGAAAGLIGLLGLAVVGRARRRTAADRS
jgi:hypothetical protein